MALWTFTDTNANSGPKMKNTVAVGKLSANLYANVGGPLVTSGQGGQGQVVGVFGVDITEQQFSNSSVKPSRITHAGWVAVRQGVGAVANLLVANNGSGYSNTHLVKVSNGAVNAAANVNTDGAGGITGFTITNFGNGFINVAASVVALTNSTGGATGLGTGGVLTLVLGGRAGRIQYETLVAGGMANTANGSGAIPGVGI